MFGAFVVQIVAAVVELRNHELTTGNLFFIFAGFMMLAGSLSLLAKFFMMSAGMKPVAVAEGWMWMATALFLTLITPVFAKQTSLLFLLIVITDVTFWLISGSESGWITSPSLPPIIGGLLMTIGFINLYLAGAIICNTIYGKSIFYLPKPLVK